MKIEWLFACFVLIYANSNDYEPAKITTNQGEIRVTFSESVTLSCNVAGYLISNFTWSVWGDRCRSEYPTPDVESRCYEIEEELKRSANFLYHDETHVTMTLRIATITYDHGGFYSCKANYPGGTIIEDIHLIVVTQPYVKLFHCEASGANTVYLRGRIYSEQDPVMQASIQYIKNGTERWQDYAGSIDTGFYETNVGELENGTAYMFRIVASNSVCDLPAAYSQWVTTWKEEDDFITNFSIAATTFHSISIILSNPLRTNWEKSTYYRIEVTTKNGTIIEKKAYYPDEPYDLENLEPETSYRIKVTTCYEYSHRCGNGSTEQEVTTIDREQSGTIVSIKDTTLHSITIEWTAPHKNQNPVHHYKVMAEYDGDILQGPICVPLTTNSYVFENLPLGNIYKLSVATCSDIETICSDWHMITAIPNASVAVSEQFIMVGFLLVFIVTLAYLINQARTDAASRRRFVEATLQRFNGGALDCLNPELNIGDQAELLPYDMKWEYPRELLKLDKILGSGAFGTVRKAEARSICRYEVSTTVAVKEVKSTASLHHMTALSRELKILTYLGKHINVVNLLGACTKNVSYGQLLVIVEFCRFGNLHDYLRRRRADFVGQFDAVTENFTTDLNSDMNCRYSKDGGANAVVCDTNTATVVFCPRTNSTDKIIVVDDNVPDTDTDAVGPSQRSNYQGDYTDENLDPISTRDLLYWAWQVSCGMKYLGSRKILHGDLAARNILLAENNVVKICDFGMAKALLEDEHYKKKGHELLPVKWMALESLRDRIFSVHSDIWSYGIVLWELFSLAETPYPGIRPEDLCLKLADGFRLAQPKYAPREIYRMMLHCWDAEPSNRPSFDELVRSIDDLLDDSVKTHYFDLSAPYVRLNTDALERGEKDYLTMTPLEDARNTIEQILE